MVMKKIIFTIIIFANIIVFAGCANNARKIYLARNGEAQISINLPPGSSSIIQFAGNELTKYLQKISEAKFIIDDKKNTKSASIKIEIKKGVNEEAYEISIKGKDIILAGNSDRAILYAVYGLLNHLGCQWLSPDFDYYKGASEIIPHQTDLFFESSHAIITAPAFKFRKLDVAGGRSHNTGNLKKIIEWMPKLQFNTLMIPMNANNHGRVQWDKWREQLTPELKKRGIMIEVGQHGYQNFLNAGMEDSSLFKKHPDWFGKDSNCIYTSSDRLVFNTADSDAVNYFINNIITYLDQRPEINIFDLWPPDVGRWQDCASWQALGTPQDRQAKLANKVDSAIKRSRLNTRLEIIAYSFTLLPPENTLLNKDILVDFCPINQSFEKQIYDTSSSNNYDYLNAILNWKSKFAGDVGIYSYYRKYAWRSLPNIIPHYIQRDMQWYANERLQGISTYAEPGDWFTYELNYYILGKVAWNPDVDIDSLIHQFLFARYGDAYKTAELAYTTLEKIVRSYGSVSFTKLKSVDEIQSAINGIEKNILSLRENLFTSSNSIIKANFSRLLLMMKYAKMDLQIQHSIASEKPNEEVLQEIKALLTFLEANIDKGVFILTGENDLARFTKKYGLTHQSLLD